MWPFKNKQKETDFTQFLEELHVLCKEWFHNQIHDLPEDELPPQEEIDRDIVDMRDDTFQRVLPFIQSSKSVVDGQPNDTHNLSSLYQLVEKYNGHESTTPIFAKLALSKAGEPKYQAGWSLCVVRVIAEAWLEQSTTA